MQFSLALFLGRTFRPTLIRTAMLVATSLLLSPTGCAKKPDPAEEQAQQAPPPSRMRVVVVDDEPFAAALEQLWKARIENGLQLKQMTAADLEKAKQLNADLVIYPSEFLGLLAERRIIASPSEDGSPDAVRASSDVFELQRRVEVQWGGKILAFSFGSPQIVVMYRADLFESLKLTPPTTWAEYAELLPRLAREQLGATAPAADKPWSATVEPLGAGWRGKVLLARAAAYASHPSQFSTLFDCDTMQPLIAGPPFQRALEEMLAAVPHSPTNFLEQTPETARQALLAGEAAMVLTWPCRATASGKPLAMTDGIPFGFADLPGGETVYNFAEQSWTPNKPGEPATRVPLLAVAGRLASVTSNARRPREAAGILQLLTGHEWSDQIAPASVATTAFRKSQLKDLPRWIDDGLTPEACKLYGELLESIQSRSSGMPCLRIPGTRRYMEVLDDVIARACQGTVSPTEALTEAAAAWQKITEELGIEAQRTAYRHSLGLEP
jgi:ABC-type glycerol-3-phosphate transport system substrate-binding protein